MHKKIVIAHIVQSTIGGVAEYLKILISRLDKDLFENIIICPTKAALSSEMKALGIKVVNLEMKRDINIKDISLTLKLIKILKENKVDIVHAHSSKAGADARMAAFFAKKPCIYTPHNWSFNMRVKKYKTRIYTMIERFLTLFTKYIIQVSDYEYGTALKHRIKKSKLVVFKNAIDIDRFEKVSEYDKLAVKKELNIKEDKTVVGMVARLTEAKSPQTFVKVAKKLLERDNNMFFIFVGDGEYREAIEEELKRLNISDNFLITGWVKEIEKYLAIMDVGVLTSIWEGLSLTVIEYLAAKVPVAASNIGGVYDVIIDNYCGFLVEPDDTNGFAKKIERLAYDNQLRERFISNGYELVKKEFQINRLVDQHKELYKKLIEL